jgi:hypothetical protein
MALNIKQLMALADRLDKEGQHDEADKVDAMVKKLAITMVKRPDPQFEEEYQEEYERPVGEYYVGKPDDQAGPDDELMPTKEEPLLDEALKLKLSKLAGEGWNIFGPGELEQWLDIKGYKKMEDMPEEEVARIREELEEKQASTKLAGVEEEPLIESSNNMEIFEKLADIADRLDKLGSVEESNLVDAFIQKHAYWGDVKEVTPDLLREALEEFIKYRDAAEIIGLARRYQDERPIRQGASNEHDLKKHADDVLDYEGEDEKGEQSKRYDSKHHHSLQIREPKTKQERVDREGRENHHMHTMQHVEAGALNTRYCPEHVGVTLGRVGELTYQCPLDGSVYNWETGWTDYDGKEHPGGSVAGQTPDSSGYAIPHRIFDSRENISNRVN